MRFQNQFLVFVAIVVGLGEGFVIHSSCNSIKPDLLIALGRAFAMAKDVEDQLSSTPVPPLIAELATMLFGTNTAEWTRVVERMKGVRTMNTEIEYSAFTRPATMSFFAALDVIFYCNFEHLTQPTVEGIADPRGKNDGWYWFKDEDIADCKAGTVFNPLASRTYAFTRTDEQYREDEDNDGRNPGTVSKPSEIYLCEWYLQHLAVNGLLSPVPLVAAERAMKMTSLSWQGILNKVKGTTQVDFLARLEGTILHELTHTIPAQISIEAGSKGESNSYGWLDCLAMKRQRNADSLALMGVVTNLISNTIYKASADGHIILQTASIGKRELSENVTTADVFSPVSFIS